MSYRLLDSGHGRKLEDVGGVIVTRQAPTAIWAPSLSRHEWDKAEGVHHRSEKGGGRWEWLSGPKFSWNVTLGANTFLVKPTPFGHVGLFAEQEEQWRWITESVEQFVEREQRAPEVLNLFAYTGGSTLAAARGGAKVTHVDAAKGVVDWGRHNAELNELQDAPIRWMVDDCISFVEREVRRGKNYDGLILDPPTFGRGKKNEVWTIDKNLGPLLLSLQKLVNSNPAFLLLSCHSPGYTPIALEQLADDYFGRADSQSEGGEMSIPHENSSRRLPSGFFTRRRR
ncbi:MAG: 23S rRNA (cytosine1962-C5)-methyltransferase [Planctomycetota bacterium]|jgi:23S rRNA (cytosine1962-C5)-methyltransferase